MAVDVKWLCLWMTTFAGLSNLELIAGHAVK